MIRIGVLLIFVAALALAGTQLSAWAQSGNPAAATEASPPLVAGEQAAGIDDINSFWGILSAGGKVGFVIILLSVAAVALVFEHIFSIRAGVLNPPQLADQVRGALAASQTATAMELCRRQPSVLASVLIAGLAESDGGWPAVEKATEDTLAEQSARLFRKVEYLSVIGNIAPMLGLLGTVIGMVFAFREVSVTQGAARAADLAQGIYLALITTVEGLIVAIPAMAAFAVFRSRVDQLMAEVAHSAQHAFTPLRQMRSLGRRPPVVASAPPSEGRA